MQYSRQISSSTRKGVTVTELLVACVVLSAALVTTQSFHSRSMACQQAARQSRLVQRLVNNARQEIASWPIETVTLDRITGLGMDPVLAAQLPGAVWLAEVADIHEPIDCKQVWIALQWNDGPDVRTSHGRTFWLRSDDRPGQEEP